MGVYDSQWWIGWRGESGHNRQLAAGLSAALCVISTGTCFGWVAPNLLLLLSPNSPVPMISSQASWMIALLELGNLITPMPAGYLADNFGRKPITLATSLIYVSSWVIIYNAKTFVMLCVARVLQGCALGVVFTVVPMYLGEIPSPRFRGTITSIFQTAMVTGYLFESVVSLFVSYKTLAVISGTLPVIFMLSFLFQPETPYYYLMHANEKGAATSLAYLRGKRKPEDVIEELSSITESMGKEMSNQSSWKDIVGTSTDRQALLIVNVVGVVRILGGSIAIPAYCTQVFFQTGFTTISPNVLNVIMTITSLIFGVMSSVLMDITGRRPLLIVSCVGCAINLFIVAVYFFLKNIFLWDSTTFSWICPLALISYSLCLSVGLDPVYITYTAEMFPSNTRSTAASINTIVSTLGSFFSLKFYQVIADHLGLHFLYLGFTLICFAGALWLYINAIETRGKTFSEVQLEIQTSVQIRRKQRVIRNTDVPSQTTMHM